MNDNGNHDKQVRAYDRMLERLKAAWHKAGQGTLPTLLQNLEQAQEKASELGELTREEAARVAEYLRRDLQDAGEYLADSGRQLGDWLEFDLKFAESKLADLFASVVDQSRVELAAWERQTHERHTGEVTGIGVLECQQCGETLNFVQTGHIPPCPKCHGTVFVKRYGEG